ncbi:MAG: hypothetical protein ACYTEL_26470 [Planctomycetota bacterium]|jgi:hypothetical protein
MKDKRGTFTICDTQSGLIEPRMDIVHYKIEPSFDNPDGYTEGNTSISEAINKAREAKARNYEIVLVYGKGAQSKYAGKYERSVRLRRKHALIFRKELNL